MEKSSDKIKAAKNDDSTAKSTDEGAEARRGELGGQGDRKASLAERPRPVKTHCRIFRAKLRRIFQANPPQLQILCPAKTTKQHQRMRGDGVTMSYGGSRRQDRETEA